MGLYRKHSAGCCCHCIGQYSSQPDRFLILTPTDHRTATLTFLAGAGLGYYLELWGTTRECWTYYTFQKPPLFAVLAHGMAAVAFWRAGLVVKQMFGLLRQDWQRCRSVKSFSLQKIRSIEILFGGHKPSQKYFSSQKGTNMIFIAFHMDKGNFP